MSETTPTTSPAHALQANGQPIPLADGTTAQLRYTMASLVALEESFGNVAKLMTSVQEAAEALQASQAVAEGHATPEQRELHDNYQGPSLFRILRDAIAPGLLDHRATDPRSGEQVWLGEHPDVLARLMLPNVGAYMPAFGAAFREAFANLAGGDAADPQTATTAGSSPGTPGGTSLSASTGTLPTASGA